MTRQARMILSSSVFAFACAALIAGSLPFEAVAQDALGAGNALDQNSQIGSGGRNSGAPLNPFAGRNRVVTGEVLGGREFRGRVGYTAPGDFRGSLGSDDLYRFQAGSAWSSPSALSLGTTTYDQLRFGQDLGTFVLPRPGEGATPGTVGFQPAISGSFAQEAQTRWQFDNVSLSALSSAQQQQVTPSMLRAGVTPDGRALALMSSPIRGLSLEQFDMTLRELGLTPYDQIRAQEEMLRMAQQQAAQTPPPGVNVAGAIPTPQERDREAAEAADSRRRIGSEFQTRFEGLRSETRTADNVAETGRVEGAPESDYAQILQRIVDRYAHSDDDRNVQIQPGLEAELNREYERLRQQLSGREAPPRIDPRTGQPVTEGATGAPSSSEIPGTTDSTREPGKLDRPDQRDPRSETDRPGEQPARPKRDPVTGKLITPEESEDSKSVDMTRMGPVLQHGQKVDRLSSEEQGRFNELMMDAEGRLRKGEFMAAEQRFQRALRFTPGHPLAMAGAANAQIGAEYYLAAALTLRMLFTDHPEMIDTTYDESLLPRERLETAVKQVRQRLETNADREAYSFLLGYLGRQLNDRAIMEEGIAGMAQDDPLAILLRKVWMEREEQPGK